jgi:hypothetical protein
MEISQGVAHEVPQNHCTASLQENQTSVNKKINFNNYIPQQVMTSVLQLNDVPVFAYFYCGL